MSAHLSDEHLMSVVYTTAQESDDHRTKIGAILVNKAQTDIAERAANVSMVGADIPAHWNPGMTKKFWMAHAELRVVIKGLRRGLIMSEHVLWTQGTPCLTCAPVIIESGLKKIIVHGPWDRSQSPGKSNATLDLFMRVGVVVKPYDGKVGKVIACRDDHRFFPNTEWNL